MNSLNFRLRPKADIKRCKDNARSEDNLRWLSRETGAHIHADLIIGLPGEGMASFGAGLDRLLALGPQEIQLGLLKRLRGTPIERHSASHRMVYHPYPPYQVVSTSELAFASLQRLSRFARYWDLVINSGRFGNCRALLLGDAPFDRFLRFSDWLYATTGQTHRVRLERLLELVYRALTELLSVDAEVAGVAVWEDFSRSGLKGIPAGLRPLADGRKRSTGEAKKQLLQRQARHQLCKHD